MPGISTPTTITGPGASNLNVRRDPSLSPATLFRLFAVSIATPHIVTIQGMTISGARAGNSSGGGLIKSGTGTVVLDSVWLSDNQVSGNGGAIRYDGGLTSIRNSALSGNQAAFGGAINGSDNAGAMTEGVGEIVNSTVSGNSATDFGGGIYVSTGEIKILSSTIQGNAADSDNASGGSGGGTYNAGPQATAITVATTLYAGNKVGTTSPVDNQCGGAHTSSGYNLRQTTDVGCTGFTEPPDIVNGNPMLGATLGDNGGPTPTIPLLSGSPAINAGNPGTPADNAFPACPTTDQRGVSRLGGGNRCDIGAFERRSPTTTTVTCAPSSLTLGAGVSSCSATVTDVASLESPSGNVSFTTSGSGTFSEAGSCTLPMVAGPSASCAVTYTPSAVGTSSHLITASYQGTPDWVTSQGSTQIAVLAPVTPTTPVPVTTGTTGTNFDLKAAIKKCKKKFPKGPKRKKCIKRAKRRARA